MELNLIQKGMKCKCGGYLQFVSKSATSTKELVIIRKGDILKCEKCMNIYEVV